MSPTSPTQPTTPRPGPKRTSSRVRFGNLGFTPVSGGAKDGAAEDDGGKGSVGGGLGSDPGTPNISEAAAQLRRTLSLANLDNLLLITSTATASLTTALSPSPSRKSSRPPGITTTFTSSQKKTAVFTTGAPESATTDDSTPSSPDRLVELDAEQEKAQLELERRQREARELLRGVKGAVWRPAGERKKLPSDLERVFVLAMQKATRSFISAYGLRAGVNLVLFLFKSVSSRSFSLRHLRLAVLSAVPLRFSLLLSTFTYLHTLTSHTLRLSPSPTYLRRRISHSLNALRTTTAETTSFLEALEEGLECLATEAPVGPPSAEYDETDGERRWHAPVAGLVAGAGSIYWVKREGGDRRGVVEQLVVRGLEGFWKGATRRLGWHIPGGEILLFGLCSGQLMHSWLAAPERNPPAFNHFISGAFQGPSSAVAIQRSLYDSTVMPHAEVEKLLSYKRGVSAENRSSLESILASLGGQDLIWQGGRFIPCAALHPDHTHCIPNLFARFLLVFQHMLPVYAALHLIPQLIFKRRLLFSQPRPAEIADEKPASTEATRKPRGGMINWKELTKLLWRALKGTLRSGSFLSGFVVIFHAMVCLQHKLYPLLQPGRLRTLLVSSKYMWLSGFMTTFSLFLEEKRRRSELALYVLPRGLQILHSSARSRSWLPRHVPLGEGVVAGLAMGVLCDRVRWGPGDLGGLVKRMMYQFT